jgi:hypothetical protein
VKAMIQAKIETSSVHIVPDASQPRYVIPPEGAVSRNTFQSMAEEGAESPPPLVRLQSGNALVRQTFSSSALIGTPMVSPEGSFSVNHLA